jgi:hypothetical protein
MTATVDDSRDASRRSVLELLDYCRARSWKGYDPYDGLNSPLSRLLPASRFFRTALTQVVKRSPLNLRPLLGIGEDFNPKGLALAARAVMLLARFEGNSLPAEPEIDSTESEPLCIDFRFLIEKLLSLRVSGEAEFCWGYNFDWQSRAFFAPRGTPNAVCTAFAAQAMLDWYAATNSGRALGIAESSCRFLLDRMSRMAAGDNGFYFSYTPLDRSAVHNVNLLVAELLARASVARGRFENRGAIEAAVEFTLSRQRKDGSWFYGEAEDQKWIDSFHTGFVLVSLRHLIEDLGRSDWRENLIKGYEYYRERFLLADGTPGYYHDRLYPVDVHSAAQAVVTFSEMTDLMPNAKVLASRAARWAITNLQDPAGHFYFQRHRFYTIRIPYMRWAQSWMLYALSLYLTRSLERDNV